ncbi:MAG: hypothetical protein WC821_00985 [archaeon]|jgi:hypothetical protein
MINEQVMMDTVSRMLEAGIDEPTILSTLVDTGLTQEEAVTIVNKSKAPQVSQTQNASSAQTQQDIALVKNQIEIQSQTQEMNDASVHNKLDMHEQKIDEVSKKLDEVKTVVSSTSNSPQDSILSYRITDLEKKLEEVNSISKATLDIMKNILETDRKILTELEAKK